MPKWAVGHADYFNNDLNISIVETETAAEAIIQVVSKCEDDVKWLKGMPDTEDKEEVKQFFFDVDQLIDYIKIGD